MVKNRIKYENENSINYDSVFRIRTDMAFRQSGLKEKTRYLQLGLDSYNDSDEKGFKDDKIIFVNYLQMLYGYPMCGDQLAWGKKESIDNVFGDCTSIYLEYLKDWLYKQSSGIFKDIQGGIAELFHIEIALPYLASRGFCGIIARMPVMRAGEFSLIRDTVNRDDSYDDIAAKAADFYSGNAFLSK